MRLRLIVTALGLGLALPAHAKTEPDWPSGSAMAVGKIYIEKHDYFARRLEVRQARLVELVGSKAYKFDHSRLVAAIENQHKAYLDYAAQECEVIGALSGAGGTWPSTYNMKCQATLIERPRSPAPAAAPGRAPPPAAPSLPV